MKFKHFFALIFIFAITFAGACQNDPNDVADKRDNILGDWHMTLNDGQVDVDYQVTITKDADDATKINLSNFVNNGSSAYATITGFDLTVPQQQVGNSIVSGDGTIKSDYNSITWNLTIDGDVYTGTMSPGGITQDALAK